MTIMNINTSENKDAVAEHTGQWLEKAVIGLNLCPFAKAPTLKTLSASRSAKPNTLTVFGRLGRRTAATGQYTRHRTGNHPAGSPDPIPDFDVFNDMLDIADAAVVENGLEGIVQIAPFHPDFQFEAHGFRRHWQLHQPFSLSDAAPHPRRQHCQSRTSLSRRFGNIRTQYRPAGKMGHEALGKTRYHILPLSAQ